MDTNTKRCPFCGEEILMTAKKCKHCKQWIVPRPDASQAALASASTSKPKPVAQPIETEDDESNGVGENLRGITQLSFIIAVAGTLFSALAICPDFSGEPHSGLKTGIVIFALGFIQSIGISPTVAAIIEAVGATGLWYGLMKRLEATGRPQTFFIILSIILSLSEIVKDNVVIDVLVINLFTAEVVFSIVLVAKYTNAIRNAGVAMLAAEVAAILTLVILPFIGDDENNVFYFALVSFAFSWIQYKFLRDAIIEETD